MREELTKAIPLFLMVRFTSKIENPTAGIVLGIMSGIGFAVTENVFYVFTNLNEALGAAGGQASLATWSARSTPTW